MPEDEEQLGYATIDDPDPAPQRAGRGPRWEWLLGGLLVLGLGGLGLGQWWDQQARLAHYQAGTRAAAAQDWPAARAAYTAAAGYADAGRRAAEADRMAAYVAAVSGTVALRPGAVPPGLYAYGAGGWHLLAGSDHQSRLLATCPDGALLYDGPWAGAGPPPTPEPGRVPVRRLLVGSRAGAIRARLALDPARFEWYRCTAAGVWGAWSADVQAGDGDAHFAAPELFVAYQAFGAARPTVPVLPGVAWFVGGLAPDGQSILLVDPDATAGGIWRPGLYRAAADGSRPHLLTILPGAPGPSVIDPGGHALIFTAYQPVPDTRGYTNTVLLLDPAGVRPPQILAEARVQAEVFDQHFRIAVQVLQGPPRAGQVLLIWPEGDHAVVRLVDPAHPTAAPRDFRTAPGFDDVRLLSADAPDGTILLAARDALHYPEGRARTILVLDVQNRAQTIILPLAADDGILDAWVRAGRLVYTSGSYTYGGAGGAGHYVFHTLSLPPEPGLPTSPVILSGTVTSAWPSAGSPWHSGLGLLAYTTAAGDLRARDYAGAGDRLLEPAIGAFFANGDTP